jgi:hypothetical protein
MDKENNNKLKKYKQKYTTGGRVDYSKGGRVGYAKGQNVKGGLATTEMETSKRKVKRPKPPTQGIRKAVTPLSQNKLKSKIIPNSTKGLGQISIDQNDRAVPTEDMSRIRTTEASSPVQTAQAFRERKPRASEDDFMSIGGVGGGQGGMGTNEKIDEEERKKQEEERKRQEEERKKAEEKAAAEKAAAEEAARLAAEEAAKKAAAADIMRDTETPVQEDGTVYSDPQLNAQQRAARKERIRETGLQIEAASTGEVPEGAIIDPAVQVGIDPETGKPFEDQKQKVTEMDKATKVGYQRDSEGNLVLDENGDPIQIQAGQVAPETVSTGTVKTATTPEDIEAGQITQDELDIVALDADVTAAQGDIQEDKLAKAAEVDRVAPIEGADVDIPEGALAERVVGKISDGAKATAVMNVGSSLSRITRAKKQLSRAGLSDEDIKTIGNDPEDLEDRLADFSEEQRGIIEGLPEEALVSTQINGLLEGMENGEIPVWARPAVAQVEQMLAKRGMSASTVGRDNLFNAIIQSAMPIAQSNAQAIQQSVSQQKNIEAQEAEANAARGQQTALTNAQNVFQMDMAQFSADQQTSLSNSKFMQTVALTEASNEQQAALQDAVLMSQANLAEADFYQKAQIQNAQAFLSMNMANLNNRQQANVLKSQQNQQRLLSNQSAQNAAAQFNAVSENQTQQFMSNLKAQTDQYNISQQNNMEQFNATQENAAEARRAGREADVNKFNAQLFAQVDQFNSQQDFARESWNAQNAAAVEASNVQWRRQANTINTAAQNTINMQNAQNAFGMSMQSQSFLWQELRDQADFDFRAGENELNRQAQIISTAIANEGDAGKTYDDYLKSLVGTLSGSYRSGLTSSYGSGSSNQGGTRAK